MRYLIEAEYRKPRPSVTRPNVFPYAAMLRRELSERNIRWAIENGHAHEVSMGKSPPFSIEKMKPAGMGTSFLKRTGGFGRILNGTGDSPKFTPPPDERLSAMSRPM